MNDQIIASIQAALPDAIETSNVYLGEFTLVIRKHRIRQVCTLLRDELGFDSLRDLCGADYYRPEERFEVIYNLYALARRFRLRLKVRVDEADLRVDSVSGVWSTANWHERETYDMFGIRFEGHPDLRRIYLPEEFAYHPLRKDFPLMGIPGSLPLPRK
jgi:NADH-quinone oxidoreductase subunit C